MDSMSAQQWLLLICLGGLAGALGQLARAIVGLKKANDEAAAANLALKDVIEPSRLVISIAIGFTAGALAALLAPIDLEKVTMENILAFAAAGYAGADFIESAMSKALPNASAAKAQPTSAAAPADEYLG